MCLSIANDESTATRWKVLKLSKLKSIIWIWKALFKFHSLFNILNGLRLRTLNINLQMIANIVARNRSWTYYTKESLKFPYLGFSPLELWTGLEPIYCRSLFISSSAALKPALLIASEILRVMNVLRLYIFIFTSSLVVKLTFSPLPRLTYHFVTLLD